MEKISGLITFHGAESRPGGQGQPPGTVRESRKEEERKQFERQTGGRDDAGDDEDLESDEGRGVESP